MQNQSMCFLYSLCIIIMLNQYKECVKLLIFLHFFFSFKQTAWKYIKETKVENTFILERITRMLNSWKNQLLNIRFIWVQIPFSSEISRFNLKLFQRKFLPQFRIFIH